MTRKEYAWYMSEHVGNAGVDIFQVYATAVSEYSRHTSIDLVVRFMEYSRNMSEYPTSTDSRCGPRPGKIAASASAAAAGVASIAAERSYY